MPADGREFRPTRASTAGWILYDLANTLFSFVILSFYFGPWLTQDLGARDSAVTVTQSASMVVVLVLAPILGALTDRTRRMPFLMVSTLVAVLSTVMLGAGVQWGFETATAIAIAVAFYALANVGFQLGLVFYDALLPSVSTPATVGRVGSLGVGLGYFGSFVGLALATLLLGRSADAEPTLFGVTGVLFLFLAIPCFLFVRERIVPPTAHRQRHPLIGAFRQVVGTIKGLRQRPGVGRFLIARILYADAINTFIIVLGIYAVTEAGFQTDTTAYSIMLALSIVFAVAGAPVWGWMADRNGPRATLSIVMYWWMATLMLVIAHPLLGLPQSVFFVVGPMAGIGLGGTWSADRPLMLGLAPAGQVGEYYGLYALAGRFAAITGPLLWALVVDVLRWGRPAAVFGLFLFVVAASVVLRKVPDARPTDAPSDPVAPRVPVG